MNTETERNDHGAALGENQVADIRRLIARLVERGEVIVIDPAEIVFVEAEHPIAP
jgi:hypothetical protein